MKPSILYTAEADALILEPLRSRADILEAGWNLEKQVLGEDDLIRLLADREIFVTSYDRVSRRVLEACPSLKLVVCTRSNPVNVDTAAARELGVTVAFTPGRNSDATAEFAVALMLDVSRNLARANRALMEGRIVTDDQSRPGPLKDDTTWGEVKGTRPYVAFEGPQMHGKTVGVCGFGSIGRRVGRIINGFNAKLAIFDPYLSDDGLDGFDAIRVDFQELLVVSDFISCHMQVTDQTRGMFNRDAFRSMKQTAYFINNSRGAVVDEPALVEALRERDIAGAALDVFEYEPLYAGHPFVSGELDNVLVTPHISGASADAIANHTQMVIDEIDRFMTGQTPIHGA